MPAKRTKEEQAAYMREYRAKRADRDDIAQAAAGGPDFTAVERQDPRDARIAALEEEVRHLKQQLAVKLVAAAAPPTVDAVSRTRIEPGFNTRPFTPVPKKKT
jgi:serine/threonine-protein kinase RIO1